MFKPIRQLMQFGDMFAAACRIGQDIENHRNPNPADFDVLGIDAKDFYKR